MNKALEESRLEFEHKGKRDLEVALEESLSKLQVKKETPKDNIDEIKKRSFD